MRKTKIVDDEPKWTMPPVIRWKCPTCRTWVKEEMSNQCTACKNGTAPAHTDTPAVKKPTTKKSAPKMFSDLGDMFGH